VFMKPIGLAVSGGVDSMALATLCKKLFESQHENVELKAFIVDHKIRRESTMEAYKVANVLQQKCKLWIHSFIRH
jgi:tRNA(Ile)-lysidine synthase